MVKNKKIKVESTEISVSLSETTDNDYICLTDSNTWECGSN